ncbi:MAG: hypothetical protein V3V94_06270 [Candidatus Brocadiales bacterium]
MWKRLSLVFKKFCKTAKGKWWLWLTYIPFRLLEARFYPWINSKLDDYNQPTMIYLKGFLNWAIQDTLSITGIIFFVVILVLIILAYIDTRLSKPRKKQLKEQCSTLSNEILQFLNTRQQSKPNLPSPQDDWNEQINKTIRYEDETVTLFHQIFGPRVIVLYENLNELGFSDKKIDSLYEHPTNALGIRELGQRLGALAQKQLN